MADQDRPNQNANKSKAEGDRSTVQQSGQNDRDGDAGGITNRPLSEEVENQQDLPPRGTTRHRTGDPESTRREGDSSGDER